MGLDDRTTRSRACSGAARRPACGRSSARSSRARASASRPARSCATSRSRCASAAARRPRSARRRRRSRCSSRSIFLIFPAMFVVLLGPAVYSIGKIFDSRQLTWRHRAGELVLRREDDGRVLCERCVLADTLWRRLRGLLGRRELAAGRRNRPAARRGRSTRSSCASRSTSSSSTPTRSSRKVVAEPQALADGDLPRRARRRRARAPASAQRYGVEAGQRLAWAARPERPPGAAAASRRTAACTDEPMRRATEPIARARGHERRPVPAARALPAHAQPLRGRVDEARRRRRSTSSSATSRRRRHRRDRLARRRRARGRRDRGAAPARRRARRLRRRAAALDDRAQGDGEVGGARDAARRHPRSSPQTRKRGAERRAGDRRRRRAEPASPSELAAAPFATLPRLPRTDRRRRGQRRRSRSPASSASASAAAPSSARSSRRARAAVGDRPRPPADPERRSSCPRPPCSSRRRSRSIPTTTLEWVLASLFAALFLFLPLLVFPTGMGMGDVKLAALLGAVLGKSVVAAILIGMLARRVYSLALLLREGMSARKKTFAYGPFLAFGGHRRAAARRPLASVRARGSRRRSACTSRSPGDRGRRALPPPRARSLDKCVVHRPADDTLARRAFEKTLRDPLQRAHAAEAGTSSPGRPARARPGHAAAEGRRVRTEYVSTATCASSNALGRYAARATACASCQGSAAATATLVSTAITAERVREPPGRRLAVRGGISPVDADRRAALVLDQPHRRRGRLDLDSSVAEFDLHLGSRSDAGVVADALRDHETTGTVNGNSHGTTIPSVLPGEADGPNRHLRTLLAIASRSSEYVVGVPGFTGHMQDEYDPWAFLQIGIKIFSIPMRDRRDAPALPLGLASADPRKARRLRTRSNQPRTQD